MLFTVRTTSAHCTESTGFSFRLRSSSSSRQSNTDEIWDTWESAKRRRQEPWELQAPPPHSRACTPLWRRRRLQSGSAALRCCSSEAPWRWPGSPVRHVDCGDFSAPWPPAVSRRAHRAASVLPWETNAPSSEWAGPADPPGERGCRDLLLQVQIVSSLFV